MKTVMGMGLALAVDGLDKTGLNAAAVLVLYRLALCANDQTRVAWPGDAWLAGVLGISERQVRRGLGAIEVKGYVERRGYGQSRHFFVVFAPCDTGGNGGKGCELDTGVQVVGHGRPSELDTGVQVVGHGRPSEGEVGHGRPSSWTPASREKVLKKKQEAEEAGNESHAGAGGGEWEAKVKIFVKGLTGEQWDELQGVAIGRGADLGAAIEGWVERVTRDGAGASDAPLWYRLRKWVATERPARVKSGGAVEQVAESRAPQYGRGGSTCRMCGAEAVREYFGGARRCAVCGADEGVKRAQA